MSLTAVALVSIAPMMRPRAQAPPTTYTITDLGTLGGTESKAFAINSCGQVAGYATLAGGSKRPFFRPASSLIDLGVLSGDGTSTSVNNSGYVVGYSPTGGSTDRAFIWHDDNGNNANDAGEMIGLLPSGATGAAEDINDNGRVVGWVVADGGGSLGDAGFVWENNNFQLISGTPAHSSTRAYAINNAGSIVGEDSNLLKGFILRNGIFTDIPAFGTGIKSVAYAVSESDHVVGAAALDNVGSPTMHAIVWTDAGGLKDLGTLAGKTHSIAYNVAIVSGSVQVVGTSYNLLSDARAFVWQDENNSGVSDPGEMKDLNTLISPLDPTWTLQEARSINSSGQIVGFGLKTNGETHAFLLTPTSGVSSSPCLPTVNVSVSPSAMNEDAAGSLTYTFTRSITTGSPLTVNFSVSGTADAGIDYAQTGATTFTPPSGSVTIPANQQSATVVVDPTTDFAVEPNETVILTTTGGVGSYNIGTPTSATGTINNDDTIPTVSVAVAPSSAAEDGATNLVYTFNRSSTGGSLTVDFQVSGSAGFGTDYSQTGAATFSASAGTVTFEAGNAQATVTVDPTADQTVEADEGVTLTLAANPAYTIGSPSAATGTITNDDSLPGVSVAVSPTSVTEDGAANLVYTFTRTGSAANTLTVNFSVGGTADASTDYVQTGAASFIPPTGSVTFANGSPTATVTVNPNTDTTVESDETVILTITADAAYIVGSPSSATGTITNDETVQLAQSTFTVTEDSPFATITVTRSGDTSSSATVKYSTSDIAGLQSCTIANTMASERCDYTTAVGRITFAPNESSKTFTVPIVNDVWAEGNETFFVNLSSPTGASLGSQTTSTVEIVDNEFVNGTSNPIFGVEYFIRALYRDILNRQPDSQGLQNWIDTLTPCPNGGFGEPPTSNCDRLHIAAGFFQSDEYLNRGYWAFRFYMVSFNQRPTYAQFIPDLSEVGGPKSPAEEEAAKIAYADAFVQRPEFLANYSGLSGQALADALTQKTGLPQFTITAGMTNGQILRAIAERQTSLDKFLTEGTVSILYFGFQRRDPDTVGYQNNVDTLNANPNNLRHMIFIFIYSTEYLNRFGPQ